MEPVVKPALHQYEAVHTATVADLQEAVSWLHAVETDSKALRRSLSQRLVNLVAAGNAVTNESGWGRSFVAWQ